MSAAAQPVKLGPGAFVPVIGPSGAGKDTLIGLARAALSDAAHVVFPRRVVTRPPSVAEDHDSMTAADFAAAHAAQAFAVAWEAHGHGYGIPRSVEDDLRAGRTVVCNVSRAVIGELRARYACCRVVLITAPPEILQARLAARARMSDGSLAARLARSTQVADVVPDLTIENVGAPQDAARRLVELLRHLSGDAPVH